MCACFSGWSGAHCDFAAPKECGSDADCEAGHVCDAGTGMCMCEGESCESCVCGEYGGDECAAQECDADATCHGNGRCDFKRSLLMSFA